MLLIGTQVFAPGIGIEDDMSVMVRYTSGATMTYHLVGERLLLSVVSSNGNSDSLLALGRLSRDVQRIARAP